MCTYQTGFASKGSRAIEHVAEIAAAVAAEIADFAAEAVLKLARLLALMKTPQLDYNSN